MEGTEQNINNFSTSYSHRLPTISATEALEKAAKRPSGIPTALPNLDNGLEPANLAARCGGIQRGELTEVYGPPGVGKTTFALQLAINTIQTYGEQSHVVWIDTASPLAPRRFRAMMAAYKFPDGHEPPSSLSEPRSRKQLFEKISYFNAQTLPRLLTLFLHPTVIFPPIETALIVVDGLSNLISGSFPKPSKLTLTNTNGVTPQKGLHEKLMRKAVNRKWTIVADLANAMANMAALKGLAIVVLNQTTTSVKGGHKAALKSALATQGWDVATTKKGGKEIENEDSVIFVIERGGLKQIDGKTSEEDGATESTFLPPSDLPDVEPPANPQRRPAKRKVEEIVDSEDEDDDRVDAEDELVGQAGTALEDDLAPQPEEAKERVAHLAHDRTCSETEAGTAFAK